MLKKKQAPKQCRGCAYSLWMPDEGWCCTVKGLDVSLVPVDIVRGKKCTDRALDETEDLEEEGLLHGS